MDFTSVHLIGLIFILVMVVVIGIWATSKVRSAEDFTVGGRKSGASLVSGTIVGTIIGGSSTIGTAQLAFTVGLSAWWFTLGAGIALILLGLFYVKSLRAAELTTVPEYMAIHYGKRSGRITSLASSLGIFFAIVANILSALPLVSAIFGLDQVPTTWLVFMIILFYVLFGGVWGTGLVGVLKSGLIFITLFYITLISWQQMNGWGGLRAVFPPEPWFDLFGRGFWVDIGSAISLIVGTLTTQTYVQAVYGAKNSKAARKGTLMAACITLPVGLPAVMAGLVMRANFPNIAPIEALPRFILTYLPPWFGGIAIGTLLLASIGSAAGLVLGVGTMLSQETLFLLKKRSFRAVLWLTRGCVLFVTLLATIVTFGNLKSLVLEWNFLSMGLRGAGVFLPFTLAIFYPGRLSKKWAFYSIMAGSFVTLGWKLIWPTGLDPLYGGLIASFICVCCGLFEK
ncbi:SSS family solute:Na+ symporter [Sporomusaceae bacterium BoRhaA]|uniref:sodium:solute symporter family protein n=1 Tax=Pelorhabdus rhamnosifermentans TaxID=2772457 RepID=UPI001C05EE6E|nr:sodium:solute symporter family protein [Pelorhabdus rhamnosifermentans]MBU2703435.1 SSS family solute:Na+ symporter [Pelorhabdus rhamnosifermentans]